MRFKSVNLETDGYLLAPTVWKLTTINDYGVVESKVCIGEILVSYPNLRKLYTGLSPDKVVNVKGKTERFYTCYQTLTGPVAKFLKKKNEV